MPPERKGGLGRGLNALIPGGQLTATAPGVASLSVDAIEANPQQPRQTFRDAEMEGLVASIREHGVLQPLVVTRRGGMYHLIAGERRLRAARAAGLTEVPVVVRETPERQHALALSLIENIQRDDLNPLEEAEAYRRLLEEYELSHEAVARQVGRTRTHVSNMVRLLGVVPAVQGALLSEAISAGHARALAGLEGEQQEDALRKVLREELNVRETEALVRDMAASGARPRKARKTRAQDPETRELEDRFREVLQSRVNLTRGRRGGRLVVHFGSDEELDALFRRLVLHEHPANPSDLIPDLPEPRL